MKLIVPFSVSDVSLYASTVSATDPEASAGVWNPATYYALDAQVQVDSPTFTFTAVAGDTKLTAAAHGFVVGDMLKFSTTGTLPTGIVANRCYEILQASANYIKVCEMGGASPITMTTAGTGTHTATVSSHLVYGRAVAGTTATPPHKDATNWYLIGTTNRWKPFDGMVTSKASRMAAMEYTLDVLGRADSLALINLSGILTVRIQVLDPATAYAAAYDQTYTIHQRDGLLNSWWTFFFTPITDVDNFTDFDLPTVGNPRIVITMTAAGANDTCEVGAIVVGRAAVIGDTQYGASLGIIDYSSKSKDTYGNISIVERTYSDRGSFTVRVPSQSVDGVKRTLTALRATPCVYIGTDVYDSSIMYGFFKDFNIAIAYQDYSMCNIEIEGLN